jgi:drug/metabolite transporter (DMT)-like permease
VAIALLTVYVVWGSTYLGIRVVVAEAPPLLAMGTRFAMAGVLLGLLLMLRGGWSRLLVTRRQLLSCAFLGLMLPLLGNGVVSIAEQDVPSGIAALLVATTPLTITVFRALARDRPSRWTVLGVLVGFAGVGFLVLAGRGSTDAEIPLGPTLLVLVAATCWGFGSWMQPRLELPEDPFVMTSWEMLAGGLMTVATGAVLGERLDLASYSTKAWVAWAYLIVFGSMVAFTGYVWVLGRAPISLVATYAYVNPVVAVFLGALLLDEPVTVAILVGGAVIVVGVAVVITAERRRTTLE